MCGHQVPCRQVSTHSWQLCNFYYCSKWSCDIPYSISVPTQRIVHSLLSTCIPIDDAFRTHCYPHVCQEDSGGGDHWATGDRCVIDVDALANSSSKDGSSPAPCIFVRASLLPLFVQRELPRINTTVVIVTDRYNDQSGILLFTLYATNDLYRIFTWNHVKPLGNAVPDSQTTPSLRLAKWSFLADLTRYHEAGKVKALHGVNTVGTAITDCSTTHAVICNWYPYF